MSADQITTVLTAGIAATVTDSAHPDAPSQFTQARIAAATPAALLPTVAPVVPLSALTPPQPVGSAAFPLTQEPDAVTQAYINGPE